MLGAAANVSPPSARALSGARAVSASGDGWGVGGCSGVGAGATPGCGCGQYGAGMQRGGQLGFEASARAGTIGSPADEALAPNENPKPRIQSVRPNPRIFSP